MMKNRYNKILSKTTYLSLMLLALVSPVLAYPPNNAAILYYRAIMVQKEPGKDVSDMLDDFRAGKIKANDDIRKYLHDNQPALELLETAAQIPYCDWGHDFSQGFDLLLPELSKMRSMSYLLLTEVQSLVEKGERKKALDKCLILHKMAQHVGDDTIISFLVGTSMNALANERIQAYLATLPQEPETLTWLRSRITDVASHLGSAKTALNRERDIAGEEIRKDKVSTILAAVQDTDEFTGADTLKEIKNLDEAFFKKSRLYYTDVMNDVIAALDLPYQQSHTTLRDLIKRVEKDAKEDKTAILTTILMPGAAKIRSVETRKITFFNAIRAALDICIVKAETGRLPKKLPDGLPKDLFSGKDFIYEVTGSGFILRCQSKDIDKGEVYHYAFGSPKN